jgi:hypothetical protein
MSTDAPLALSKVPAFTPEHWAKVPRKTVTARIAKVDTTELDGVEWSLIYLQGGAIIRREKADIKQLLTRHLEIHVELIQNPQGELVTGVFVPDVGWAFRMTNDDLAEYAKELAAEIQDQQRRQRERMIAHVALALAASGAWGGLQFTPERFQELCQGLAVDAIIALEGGPQ